MIQFWEPMRIPRTTHNDLVVRYRKKGSKRIPYIGKSDELLAAEGEWADHLGRHTPPHPLEGPVMLDVMLVFYDETIEDRELLPMTDKPDWDNEIKTIQDVMAQLGWFAVGDQQVAEAHVSKLRSNTEGVRVDMREVA